MFFLGLFFELYMEWYVDRMCLKNRSGYFLFEGVSSGINLIWTP